MLGGLVLNGCAIPQGRQEAYAAAVAAQQKGRTERAIAAAEQYLRGTSHDDPRFDRALMLLGQAYEELGLTYAASALYREVATARRNIELLPAALRGLQRIVRTGRYDDDHIVAGFIAGSEFAEMPDDVQGFISYYQGLDSIRRNLDRWGDEEFDRIDVENEYHWRAVYVSAVRAIARDQLEPAKELLQWMLKQNDADEANHALVWQEERIIRTHAEAQLPPDLTVEIHRTLARLAFEERRFEAALHHYEQIQELAPDDPEILLELAWTYYYLGDSKRALGRLTALDAPVHRSYIAPERYVLEAFCLRRICQFAAARQAAVRLWGRHGDALDDLLQGVPVAESEALRRAARRRPGAVQQARYLAQLRHEKALARRKTARLGDAAGRRLALLYERGIEEAMIREEEALETETRLLGGELLAAEEGVRLAVHELSVSMLRGRRRPGGPPERAGDALTAGGDQAVYRFVEEFWTDELDDLVVQAEDRCID
jgi:tetratricopeptide (TPR) repeat protein